MRLGVYLLLCTTSSITHSQTLATEAHKVAQARSILILGGGTVGVELAAEIAWRYRAGLQKGGKQVCGWVGYKKK